MKIRIAATLAAALLATGAQAQTLYKLIDKNGKVTYSETAPKNFDGKVIRVDIDPKANTMVAPKPAQKGEEGGSQNERIIRRQAAPPRFDRIQEARENMEKVCKGWEHLRDNPGEGDLRWLGTAGQKGVRPVPTEDYLARLDQAEKDCKGAREHLERVEKGES